METARFLFHSIAFSYFLRVWLWHCTSAAAVLPGASGFGWFFRYLTFCSFTLQTIQLFFCTMDDLTTKDGVSPWRNLADDCSCALFGLANVVTIMYHVIEAATKDTVEGGRSERPPWLGVSVHLINSLVAWGDLLISHPRSFSPRARTMSLVFVFGYSHWLLLLRFVTGKFPYPFMNKLPFPAGYFVVVGSGMALFLLLFVAGRAINNGLNRCSVFISEHWPFGSQVPAS